MKHREGKLSYRKAGVDISASDAAKQAMAKIVGKGDNRVLGGFWAYAAMFDGRFPGYRRPVLILKSEEPGTKQELAFRYGRVNSICADLVNHLINDIIVVGAKPVAMLDTIFCGRMDSKMVPRIVSSIAKACRRHDCTLVGGETSVQPGAVGIGRYMLSATVLGVVEKEDVIDGSTITSGDSVIALASNGIHTNGYSLIRALLKRKPALAGGKVAGASFLKAILRPHMSYYSALKGLGVRQGIHGLAHVTGGGIAGNLCRILVGKVDAHIDLGRLKVPAVFGVIMRAGNVGLADMMRTFNMGAGMLIVVQRSKTSALLTQFRKRGYTAYVVGGISRGNGSVKMKGDPQVAR